MNSLEIIPLTSDEATAALPDLVELLRDAIEHGASVGFVLPLIDGELESYWQNVLQDMGAGKKILLAVRADRGQIVGSIQLALEARRNGIHRAEIQKLLVHSSARRQGIATRLMSAIEAVARRQKRSLLVLDTRKDSEAERSYTKIGYIQVGIVPGYAVDTDGQTPGDCTFFYRLLN